MYLPGERIDTGSRLRTSDKQNITPQVIKYTCQTRALREVSKARVRSDVNISSAHNVIYRISIYTMFLVTFFVSNSPSEVVQHVEKRVLHCRRCFLGVALRLSAVTVCRRRT